MEDIPLETILRKAAKAHDKKILWNDYKRKLFIEAYFKHNGVTKDIVADLGIDRIQVWRYKKRYGLL